MFNLPYATFGDGHLSIEFRHQALSELTREVGVYALCDLDQIPIYVGQSVDGIRARVRRHLTSARSDIIANRQIDVWEIAYVMAWPVPDKGMIEALEAYLFHHFDAHKPLMNGTIPQNPGRLNFEIPNYSMVQVISDADLETRRDPELRLPRQIEHYQRLVDHILTVKDSKQLRRSLRAHFERLSAYHAQFLSQTGPETLELEYGEHADATD